MTATGCDPQVSPTTSCVGPTTNLFGETQVSKGVPPPLKNERACSFPQASRRMPALHGSCLTAGKTGEIQRASLSCRCLVPWADSAKNSQQPTTPCQPTQQCMLPAATIITTNKNVERARQCMACHTGSRDRLPSCPALTSTSRKADARTHRQQAPQQLSSSVSPRV